MSYLNSGFIENMRLKRNATSIKLYQNPEAVLGNYPMNKTTYGSPQVVPFISTSPRNNPDRLSPRKKRNNDPGSALSLPLARISRSLVSGEIDELSRLKNLLKSKYLTVDN